ncbi:SRPBCC domain-containing protein [Fulvivirga kasyanovii]|uniref:SRPBCC domain-containing protein n=1 Tax=Fulvivirga kasyanovii TaxID=396812 RepID=A0ABW9RS68_9BACT|nr:SRPBCC domain-containing protein [Fulvivirga kasyanovii]MTI27008.1 SRPBCC domain-containing protein [Fulvivirga kasyanovii]
METAIKKSKSASFTYSLSATKPPEEVYELLLDVKKWWSGFYEETITGDASQVNDEFSFLAGGGKHFSRQKLAELVPHSKIVWKVIESKLTFLNAPDEWIGTELRFDITKSGDKTTVTFTHVGLEPEIECYGSCSSAWTMYIDQLKQMLNGNHE